MISSKFVGNKAGMSSIDKERVERVIAENTSANFESHEKKRASLMEERLRKNRQKLDSLTERQISQTREELDKVIEEMEKWRRLDRIKVHIDMDAFFAAVECRDDARLRDIPMAVGGVSMLSTSNYVARKFGVRSAMPGFIAKKLCPQLLIVPGSFAKYRQASSVFREVFRRYDPEVSMGSLDEASLDLTHFVTQRNGQTVTCRRVRFMGPCICRLPLITDDSEIRPDTEKIPTVCAKCGNERVEVVDAVEFGGDVESIVRQLRFEVEQATGLTCSAGIASNSMLAKICSDLNKPNGQFRVDNSREAIVSFMRTLPVRKVPGIGAVSETMLKALAVVTCGDLFEKRAIVHLLFSKCSSNWLLGVSLGICGRQTADAGGDSVDDDDKHDGDDNPKSMSIERTFTPTNKLEQLLNTVQHLSSRLVDSLPSSAIAGGRAVTLKIKFANFDVVTRCKSVNFVLTTADQLQPILETMLRKEMKDRGGMAAIRLLGVRLSQLVFADANGGPDHPKEGGGVQLSLAGFVSRRRRNEQPELVQLSSSSSCSDESDVPEEGADEATSAREHKLRPSEPLALSNKLKSSESFASNGKHCEGQLLPDNKSLEETSDDRHSCSRPSSSAAEVMGCDGIGGGSVGNIAVTSAYDDDDGGIMNIDEYFDFSEEDDDDVLECADVVSSGAAKGKNNASANNGNRKGTTAKAFNRSKCHKKSEPPKAKRRAKTVNNLHKYFHLIH